MTTRRSEEPAGQVVEFTAKELFLEINRKLDGLSQQIGAKADKSDMDKLEHSVVELQRLGGDAAQQALTTVRELEKRVQTLESEKASNLAVKQNADSLEKEHKNSQWQWVTIIASIVLGLVGVIVQAFAYRGH